MALIIFMACQPAGAAPLDWINGKAEMSAVTLLANGYARGNLCDRPIDLSVASRHLASALGADRQLSTSQAADLMFMVSGMLALQRALTGGTDCLAAEKLFGARGSAIPGLFKP